jgi:hypothetical protein
MISLPWGRRMLKPNPAQYTIEHFEPFTLPICKAEEPATRKPDIRSAAELRRKEFEPIRYVVGPEQPTTC